LTDGREIAKLPSYEKDRIEHPTQREELVALGLFLNRSAPNYQIHAANRTWSRLSK